MLIFEKMLERISKEKADSDVAYLNSLLIAGECLTKLVALSLAAGLNDDKEKSQYSILHSLVRADGIGIWADEIHKMIAGPLSVKLNNDLAIEKMQLTQKVKAGSWQHDALNQLIICIQTIYPQTSESIGEKASAIRWFGVFANLRNKTRGHGATTGAQASKISPLLYSSIMLVYKNFNIFKREWAYLHRNLSGSYRVVNLSPNSSSFNYLKSKSTQFNFNDGIYIYISQPQMLSLCLTDVDVSDFYFANGGFRDKNYELISYLTNNITILPSNEYLISTGKLPNSETEGSNSLYVVGNCLTNIPEQVEDYILRKELENNLKNTLLLSRHLIITLVGRGGIGKTSLAIKTLHEICLENKFKQILWFSARDIDLLISGPKPVSTKVFDQKDIGNEFLSLIEEKRQDIKPDDYLQLCLQSDELGGGTLFVFDNFETLKNPLELYKWLDIYIREPNKILITSRFRDFKGDYSIEVGGMSDKEAKELIRSQCHKLNVPHFGEKEMLKLLEASEGHPYVIKILVGEMMRSTSYQKTFEKVIANKDAILEALFERTFNGLSPAAKRIFLTLSSWRSIIATVALEAVILRSTKNELDVAQAIKELLNYSLIDLHLSEDEETEYLSVPLTASIFGRKKLETSAYKTSIKIDLEFLYDFGAMQKHDIKHGVNLRINKMISAIAKRLEGGKTTLIEVVPIIEFIAKKYPFAWKTTSKFYRERGENLNAIQALNHYIESGPNNTELFRTWNELAELYFQEKRYFEEAQALLEISKIDTTPFYKISYVANRINSMLQQNPGLMESEEKQFMLNQLTSVMSKRIRSEENVDGDSYSRLAWLYVNSNDIHNAIKFAELGLNQDPDNPHCKKLIQKLQYEK